MVIVNGAATGIDEIDPFAAVHAASTTQADEKIGFYLSRMPNPCFDH